MSSVTNTVWRRDRVRKRIDEIARELARLRDELASLDGALIAILRHNGRKTLVVDGKAFRLGGSRENLLDEQEALAGFEAEMPPDPDRPVVAPVDADSAELIIASETT